MVATMASPRRSSRGSTSDNISATLALLEDRAYDYELYSPRKKSPATPRPANVKTCYQLNSAAVTANGLDWCTVVKACAQCILFYNDRYVQPHLMKKTQDEASRDYQCKTLWKEIPRAAPSSAPPVPAAIPPPLDDPPSTRKAPPSPTRPPAHLVKKRKLERENKDLLMTIYRQEQTIKTQRDSVIVILEVKNDALKREAEKVKAMTLQREEEFKAEILRKYQELQAIQTRLASSEKAIECMKSKAKSLETIGALLDENVSTGQAVHAFLKYRSPKWSHAKRWAKEAADSIMDESSSHCVELREALKPKIEKSAQPFKPPSSVYIP